MDTSSAALTVSVEEPETAPKLALIVLDPVASVVAKPFEPAALLIEAIAPLEELHVTLEVRF
jgi:hypothetical protein